MILQCVWEHNGNDTMLYAPSFPGIFTRGDSLQTAMDKMLSEIKSYAAWLSLDAPIIEGVDIVQESACELHVKDADSDVIFDSEKKPMTEDEYRHLKAVALKSATDFLALYNAIPDKQAPLSPPRRTFYGPLPSTAEEMYLHTKNVNDYYFSEIDVKADHEGDILSCRIRGFENLERQKDYLSNSVIEGSYGEAWSLRKVLRRFIWHDRIHAKAMYKRAVQIWGEDAIPDMFSFYKTLPRD